MDSINWIAILDFGSQVTQLIARRIRENNIYCEIVRYDIDPMELKNRNPKGIILSGGPCCVNDADSPHCSDKIFELGIPILGICYGLQLTALKFNSNVESGKKHEYGKALMRIIKDSPLFQNISNPSKVWMSHGDKVSSLPDGFDLIAESDNCPIAAIQNTKLKIYGVQFHPEVVHTPEGKRFS